ncbi:T9SS type A sorting domain-containing protein [Psychroserpens sp.]|uniref:T9SS type A sorting domain-containing protein n=1 Tax=Psychroserpens sp. TaxID=2020870 RepID=UPI00385D99E1
MKRKLLILSLTLASFVSFAQFEVRESSTDNLITDGQTLNFTESGCNYSEPCNWKFKVTNTSSTDIFMRIFVDNLTNTDGSDFQLCFAGVCLNSVTLGSGYPNNAAVIGPGVTNFAGNNFWNQNPAGTTTAMSWTFRFQAFDAFGNQIGTPLSMTYNYDQNLSVDESQLDKIEIFPTVASNELTISSRESLTATFYNLLGKKVKQVAIEVGEVKVDVSDLASQTYIIQFVNAEGNLITKRIVKE